MDNDGDGNVDYPQDSGCSSLTDNRENSAPTVALTTHPGPGDPFQFGNTVVFDVIVTDDGPVDCSMVVVSYVLRHGQYGHPLDDRRACSGTITPEVDAGHQGQGDLAAVFVAHYTDAGGLTASDEVHLPPNP